MNKDIAVELNIVARDIAERFSNPNREANYNNETFELDEIIPLSESVAAVIFKKNTGKKAVAFFYYIGNGSVRGWKYFFPTDSHILGFRSFEFHKLEIEKQNFKFNDK
jgi:hypothetical protein